MKTSPASGDWDRLAALWEHARELPPEELEIWLGELETSDSEHASELRDMLAHHRDDSFLEKPLLSPRPAGGETWSGRLLGSFRLLEEIGRGGMSVVYRGERVDAELQQQVAVKLLGILAHPGLERRIVSERRILARLEDPGIARLIDGGISPEGVSYIVMEYVPGCPVTDYRRKRKLDLRATLRLFREICAAVQYLHRHLIVHRDLKPGNILVTDEGQPKLLDFGLARLLEPDEPALAQATETQYRALTPNYASPEQIAGGEVTTASDVYSLGVLLYELLTGTRPHDLSGKSPAEHQHIVESGLAPAAAPSRLAEGRPKEAPFASRRLRGDLDRIVLKALSPSPELRYSSASELSEDIRRYLDGQPVRARRWSWRYRLRKFVARNRLASTLAVLLGLALVTFAVVSASQARRLRAERNIALQEKLKAEEAVEFLETIFQIPDPRAGASRDWQVRDLLDRQRDRVMADLDQRPELQARLLRTLGHVYEHLGLYEDAQHILERGLEVWRGLPEPANAEVARVQSELGTLLILNGDYQAAEQHLRTAIGIFEAGMPETRADLSGALKRAAELYRERGELSRAADTMRRLIATSSPEDPVIAAKTRLGLAGVVHLGGDFETAAELARTALEALRDHQADELDQAHGLSVLGEILRNLNAYDEAEDLLRQACEIYRRRVGDNAGLGGALNNLGAVLRAKGKLADAAEVYAEALGVMRRTHGEEHHFIAIISNNLGRLSLALDDPARARQKAREALDLLRRLQLDDGPHTGLTLHTLAAIEQHVGDPEQALATSDRALELLRANASEDHLWIASATAVRASILTDLGRFDEAESLLISGLENRRKVLGNAAPAIADSLQRLARLRRLQGNLEVSIEHLRQAVSILGSALGKDRHETAAAQVSLADTYLQAGESDRAASSIRQALPVLKDRLPEGHWQILAAEHIAAAIATGGLSRSSGEGRLLAAYSALGSHHPIARGPIMAARRRMAAAYRGWGDEQAALHFDVH